MAGNHITCYCCYRSVTADKTNQGHCTTCDCDTQKEPAPVTHHYNPQTQRHTISITHHALLRHLELVDAFNTLVQAADDYAQLKKQ